MTDIVDSTRLVEMLGDVRAADLWVAHDEATRRMLAETHGRELERTDGFLLTFETVGDAADFAIRYHEALSRMATPLHARIGIHLGSLELRHSHEGPGNHAGIAIPITARIMSLAIGRQTLLSAAAADSLKQLGRTIRSHGHWRLKGVEQPFEIFETGDDHSPWTPPPDAEKVYRVVEHEGFWIPRRELRFNLPAERNDFVGRRAALRSLADRVESGARLVSILGPGGTGKTRLVQHFAWTWLGDFSGGVWFCDLAAATSESGLCSAVAKGLDVPLGRLDAIEQLGEAIAGRGRCLVIFDNFEQVAHFAETALGTWLSRAPRALFLVTTRTLLGIDGEEVFPLNPMETSEAEALFTERGKAVKGDFVVPDRDRPALIALMHLLEGLPLAIELAAARVRIMNVPQIVERMKERFKLLSSRHGRTERHSTLKATLDWSWDLLSDDERRALAICSVFEGGFSLDAFEEVFKQSTDGSGADGVDLLQELVDKSWLREASSSRFAMLPSLQEYTLLRLPRSDDAGIADWYGLAQAAHWRYYASRTEEDATELRCADLDNLFAATRRATASGSGTAAVNALLNTWAALRLCGPFDAIRSLLTEVGSLGAMDASQAARIHYVAGAAAKHRGAHAEASREFACGLALANADDCEAIAQLACAHGELLTVQLRWVEAEALLTTAVSMAEASGRDQLMQAALNAMGGLEQAQARYDKSLACYQRALTVAVGLSDRRWEGGILGNLGTVYYTIGRLDEARDHYLRALAIADEIGDRRWAGNTKCNLGLLLQDLNLFEESRDQLAAALTDARELGHQRLELTVLWNLGLLANATDDQTTAARHFEDALVMANRLADDHSSTALKALIKAPGRNTMR